jgi:ribonuclease-3
MNLLSTHPFQVPHVVAKHHIFDYMNKTLYRHVIENVLQIPVRDTYLYTEAFTHKSALSWYQLPQSYERLEFIGDSVLSLIVTRFLFERFQNVQEGFLTRLRTKIVSGKMLCTLARRMGLQHVILMDVKALENHWNENDRILEDVFEALLGAIYLDLGLDTAKRFLLPFLHNMNFDELMTDSNYKDILMRFCQSKGWELPKYHLLHNTQKWFHVQVEVMGVMYGSGEGSTKKEAEQQAAMDTIHRLEVDPMQLKRK